MESRLMGVFFGKITLSGSNQSEYPNVNKRLGKLKTLLKIFLRYLRCGVILTKDNLAKRNWPLHFCWQGNQQCCFCHENETVKHLFLTAVLRGWLGP